MHSLYRFAPFCFAAACAMAAPSLASAASVRTLPHNLEFLATSGPGPVDPAVLVGFNPQPDPPGDNARVDLSNPIDPSITQNLGGPQTLTVLFGLHGPTGDPFTFSNTGGSPDTDGVFRFMAAGDGSVFQVTFNISGFDGSWVGFNPQPDPPGDFGDSFVGFSFTGDATLHFSMEEGTLDGDVFVPDGPVSFSAVPEPGSASLALLGVGGLVAMRRRR